MAEVLTEYTDEVVSDAGDRYSARACGGPDRSGLWEGWLEFTNLDTGDVVVSARETTQPNRTDTAYWSTGLTHVYLEGALERALHPTPAAIRGNGRERPAATRPASIERPAPAKVESILNPFSVYRKGEALLRRQLTAFSTWHLVNIIRDHRLSDRSAHELNGMRPADLIDVIVSGVEAREAVGRA